MAELVCTERGGAWLGAIAMGLCIAVSALPVLIGIARELGPAHRPLSRLAVRIAVLDDAALWIGLALLLSISDTSTLVGDASAGHLLALTAATVLAIAGTVAHRWRVTPPQWVIWLMLPLFLGIGAWATSQLGLHSLLGAYFAGAMVPPTWTRRLPIERLGQFALIGLAPLFFGHSGLQIDSDVLGWVSLQASALLLVISVAAKMAAMLICPPASWMSRRESLAVGTLLQCKGVMEIVAATILRDKGLLSEQAFAALVTLAVLSTALTGPVFRRILTRMPLAAGPVQPQSA